MTWAERSAAALRQLALEVLDDATSAPADIIAAESYLASEQNLDRLGPAELDAFVDLTARALDQQVSDEHATAHELACAWQHVANARRDELDQTESIGPRIAAPRCRRCQEFSDEDLEVLANAIAADERDAKILDGSALEITDGH